MASPVHWVSDVTKSRPIRFSENGEGHSDARLPPVTIWDCFQETVSKHPNVVALMSSMNGEWVSITYSQYLEAVIRFARSCVAVDIKPKESVNIIGFNSAEWFFAYFGAIAVGGVATGVYTTNNPSACHYVSKHSNCAVVVAEDEKQLDKYLNHPDEVANVKAFVQYKGSLSERARQAGNVYDWEGFMALGEKVEESVVRECMGKQRPEECCAMIYTSGTTGMPKAVMLSHDNYTWTANAVIRAVLHASASINTHHRCVSYLPLSHVAGQMIDMVCPLLLTATVYFATPNALKGELIDTLTAARPTIFLGVPRVWEKINERLLAVGARVSPLARRVAAFAKSRGTLKSRYEDNGSEATPCCWWFANRVLNSIKARLGMEQCVFSITGAAPIRLETVQYFNSLNIPICELYGMSECTGPHTVSLPGVRKMGFCGKVLPGMELKIDNPDSKGHGEILMRGRHVFMGYYKNPEATQETIDADGYLHSGDIGFVDSDGFLKITGRIKELIITAGGENIPPVLIEDSIRAALSGVISNVMVIGDGRKFLSCLLCLNTELDNGVPTTVLAAGARHVPGSEATTIEEAQRCTAYNTYLDNRLKQANNRAASRAQVVQKFAILPSDFTEAAGELTPTLKLKRKAVEKNYADIIEGMYRD